MNTDGRNGRGRDFHSALIIPHSSLLFLAAGERRSIQEQIERIYRTSLLGGEQGTHPAAAGTGFLF
jgi:hypothetical protein